MPRPADPPAVASLDPATLKGRLDRGEPLAVLDVREPGERALCAIPLPPTAADLFIPMRQVPDRLAEVRRAVAGPTPLVVYCHHGVRSLAVGRWLAAQGMAAVLNLDGGIDAWSAEVDPGLPRY